MYKIINIIQISYTDYDKFVIFKIKKNIYRKHMANVTHEFV